MHIDDKTAGHAYQAIGDLADAFAAGIEAMTRNAIALQPNKPTVPVTDIAAAQIATFETLMGKD